VFRSDIAELPAVVENSSKLFLVRIWEGEAPAELRLPVNLARREPLPPGLEMRGTQTLGLYGVEEFGN
jgi:hypothetical protein